MTKQEAQTIYREAWERFLLSTSEAEKEFLGGLMDSVQVDCDPTGTTGKEWHRFASSLPGYNDFWNSYSIDVIEAQRQMARLMGKEITVN